MITHLFPKNLRFLRKKNNLNQEEISLLFNKRPNTIGNWENQKSEPSLAELVRLGEYFQVSIQDLLHRDLEKESGQPVINGAPDANIPVVRAYEPAESPATAAGEGDSFWFILRELRALNEKVDLLSASVENTGSKRNSDKSYH